MKNGCPPVLVAVVGGSGAGKSFLTTRLRAALGREAVCLSLDDFYRDRSGVPPARRAAINFDNPQAIDWPRVDAALQELQAGRAALVPGYDFKTHCRRTKAKAVRAKPVVLIEGLWLLRRPALRRRFDLRIFIACPPSTRLRRRLMRDQLQRGRSPGSVRDQFTRTVQPMHVRFVEPQRRRADLVLKHTFGEREVRKVLARVRNFRKVLARDQKRRDKSKAALRARTPGRYRASRAW